MRNCNINNVLSVLQGKKQSVKNTVIRFLNCDERVGFNVVRFFSVFTQYIFCVRISEILF